MKALSKAESLVVSGGEIIPGKATNEMAYLNVLIMIEQGRNQPGFDVGSAALALTKLAPHEFYNLDIALEYVRTGYIHTPLVYRLNQFLHFQFRFPFCFF